MTDPIIALESRQLRIVAGDEAISSISIRNDGMVVESYTLSVLGEVPGLLGGIDRDHVEVYPGTVERAVVRFKISPGSQVSAGSYPFAVRAQSVLDNTRRRWLKAISRSVRCWASTSRFIRNCPADAGTGNT